jgi:hypothetical protein
MLSPEERAHKHGKLDAFEHVLAMIADGCPNDCGEICLTLTDCCEEPRWECETRMQYDIRVCHWTAGCSPDA